MFNPKPLLVGLMFAALLISACQPIQAHGPEESLPEQILSEQTEPVPEGLRPDAPFYALHGPHWVGYQTAISSEGQAEPLDLGIWYPALNPTGVMEEITYEVMLKNPEWQTDGPSTIYGHALLNAPIDDTEGPYPLIIFSHGFSANPEWYSTLLEHYAFHGFIILAPEHVEQDWMESAPATIDRLRDIKQTLDYAEELTAHGGDMASLIDMENVAVVGHSFGGYTALAMGGAQIDFNAFNQRCADLSPDDPKQFLCMPLLGREAEIANRAGFVSAPTGLWPSFDDPRVTAIVPIAGDAFLFGKEGLSKITMPMMAIGGTADTGTPYDWGPQLAYDYVSSEQKALVGFMGAEHMFVSTPCENMPWITAFPYYEYFCFDPVWDKQRGLDLVHHFSTAFLLDTLKSDQAAHDALSLDAVQFPGTAYTTTLQ